MFDKNNNISLILIVLFIIIIIVYYNKNYNDRIIKLNNQIEKFKTGDLKEVSERLKKEIGKLDSIKENIGILKNNQKDQDINKPQKLTAIKDLFVLTKNLNSPLSLKSIVFSLPCVQCPVSCVLHQQ